MAASLKIWSVHLAIKKISNTLATLSAAAIVTIYGAGFQKTAPAAARFAAQTEQRLATMPVPAVATQYGLPGSFKSMSTGEKTPQLLPAPSPIGAVAAAPPKATP